MLRIHFTAADLGRTRVAAGPDPLWEVALSLHRLQTRRGRWAHAEWYRTSRSRLNEKGLDPVLRTLLLPLYPRAAYYPDFLNPRESSDGLRAGLASILDTPAERVLHELGLLAGATGTAPSWSERLAGRDAREDLVRALREYHDIVIAPHGDQVLTHIDADRSARCRSLETDGFSESCRTSVTNPRVIVPEHGGRPAGS